MSKKLLESLNGANNGLFKKYLNQKNFENLRITWYPSANCDFRALLYCSEIYAAKYSPELKAVENTDLFIYTDYFPERSEENKWFFEKDILFQKQNTTIRVVERELLPKLKHFQIYDKIKSVGTNEISNEQANHVYYLSLEVTSKQLGTFRVPLIYAVTYNEYFYKTVLLPKQAQIHQIIRVRYGGGLGGGGTANGFWLDSVLESLNVQCFITEEVFNSISGDDFFLEDILKQKSEQLHQNQNFIKIKTLPEKYWSKHGNVGWYLRTSSTQEDIGKAALSKKTKVKRITNSEQCSSELQDEISFKAFWYLFNYANRIKNGKENQKHLFFQFICSNLLNGNGFKPDRPFDNLRFMDLVHLFEMFGYELSTRKPYFTLGVVRYDIGIGKITFKDPKRNVKFSLFNRLDFKN
jgi:hypothetical protein